MTTACPPLTGKQLFEVAMLCVVRDDDKAHNPWHDPPAAAVPLIRYVRERGITPEQFTPADLVSDAGRAAYSAAVAVRHIRMGKPRATVAESAPLLFDDDTERRDA